MIGSSVPDRPLELVIGGMSCAACAARIEKRLNTLDGVEATVNYATERAYVARLGGHEPAELITAVRAAGYTAAMPAAAAGEPDPESAAAARGLVLRVVACAPAALAVIVLAMAPSLQFSGWQWVSLLLTLPVAIWGGWPLHRAALAGLRHGVTTMDTLVSLGITASLLWSVQAMLFGGAGMAGMKMPFAVTFGPVSQMTLYFDVTAGVTVAVLTGRYLESRAKRQAGSALTALARLGARTVAVLRDGAEHREDVTELARGDEFVTRPGEMIATDGVVVAGTSAVDCSLLTGESAPAEVRPGDSVTGGTINLSGRLVVRATRVGGETELARIVDLVTKAQATKSAAQRLADRVAAVFVPCVISLAVTTLGFWIGTGLPSQFAWSCAFAVLVVACPCAMGLATPTALLAGVGRGAELGVLVKGAQALEATRRVGVIVLDKTGTLTTGVMSLQAVTVAPGTAEAEVLALAGAVEDASEHPAGQAIARDAMARLGALPPVTGFSSVPGAGVRGTVAGRVVTAGTRRFVEESMLAVPAELARAADAAERAGQTAVLAGWDGRARAVLPVSDALKAGSAEAVGRLRALGLRVIMLTGDGRRPALAVARQLGIGEADVFPAVRPEGKLERIRQLQAAGNTVAMVGDGVNDAAALTRADLGIAIGTGTDAAIGAADLTLVGGDPRRIADAIVLARSVLRTIRVNLGWAFGYNLVALPLAALGYLNPLFAGLAMAISSLVVVSNSLRLRHLRADTAPEGAGHLASLAVAPAPPVPAASGRAGAT
ncbi:MAG TPA: heavy metal translocating P-type ATPase [Streptosporangiaceae bacterium]|nr:heavy metal translocating P-type ATPase [Streptosporangiaceae bacterium]